MSEDNPLALIAEMGKNSIQKYEESVFTDLTKAGDYLCRVQMCGSNSTLFKLNKIAKGNYAYVVSKDSFLDLGKSIDVLVICWRPKALDMSGDTPIAAFDVKSKTFQDICAKAGSQDSECSYGPEFLIYIPQIKKFAILHFGSKTARKDPPDMLKLLGQAATLTHRIIQGSKFIWEAITVSACSTPFELPVLDEVKTTIDKFNAEASAAAPEKSDEPTRQR